MIDLQKLLTSMFLHLLSLDFSVGPWVAWQYVIVTLCGLIVFFIFFFLFGRSVLMCVLVSVRVGELACSCTCLVPIWLRLSEWFCMCVSLAAAARMLWQSRGPCWWSFVWKRHEVRRCGIMSCFPLRVKVRAGWMLCVWIDIWWSFRLFVLLHSFKRFF